MPAAAQRNKDAWIGLDSVKEERGLKMGGWYAMIIDAGSDIASSATRVVRLFTTVHDSKGESVRGTPVPIDCQLAVPVPSLCD